MITNAGLISIAFEFPRRRVIVSRRRGSARRSGRLPLASAPTASSLPPEPPERPGPKLQTVPQSPAVAFPAHAPASAHKAQSGEASASTDDNCRRGAKCARLTRKQRRNLAATSSEKRRGTEMAAQTNDLESKDPVAPPAPPGHARGPERSRSERRSAAELQRVRRRSAISQSLQKLGSSRRRANMPGGAPRAPRATSTSEPSRCALMPA